MSRLVFDLEANGLYREATQIWCIVTKDIDTGERNEYDQLNLAAGVDALQGADLLIGHNIINFDVPLIEKLCFVDMSGINLYDTLVVSRLLNPDRRGGHSLGSWGQRLGREKPGHEDWTRYSPEMLFRCIEDVEINHLVYDVLEREVHN